MSDDHHTLTFLLSDEDLDAAIKLLAHLHPAILYPEAWRALVTEHERRRLLGRPPAGPIHLAPHIYDALPEKVKQRLRPVNAS